MDKEFSKEIMEVKNEQGYIFNTFFYSNSYF